MSGERTQPPPELLTGLRELLNRWDPIDVLDAVPDPPQDEYDRLLQPVAQRLVEPNPRGELVAYLRAQMSGTFGLDPDQVGVEPFVDRVLSWYSEVWLAGGAREPR